MFPGTGRLSNINQKVSCHVETVVLLCRKTPDDVIKVKLSLDEPEPISAESRATHENRRICHEKFWLKGAGALYSTD